MISHLQPLPSCPQWPLLKGISLGHWTNTIVEFFGEIEDAPPTHMHVYELDTARRGFRDGKFTIPDTIKTVSYGYDGAYFIPTS